MDLVGKTFYFEWEVSLIEWLQAHMGAVGTALAKGVSYFGEQLIAVVVLAFLYLCLDKRKGRTVGMCILMGICWNPMVKNVFLRRRPYIDHEGIRCLQPVVKNADVNDLAAQGYSFPSGHSTTSVALFGSLPGIAGKRKRVFLCLAFLIPFLVGVSRFCLGVHYPTDVLFGWLLGVVSVLAVYGLSRVIRNEAVLHAVLLATALPGIFYCHSDDYFTGVGLLIGFCAGDLFERRFVNFETTRHPVRCVLRILGTGVLYLGLNTLLKLPFRTDFLTSGSLAANLVRTGRYAIILFVLMSFYPMLFKVCDRIFVKNETEENV